RRAAGAARAVHAPRLPRRHRARSPLGDAGVASVGMMILHACSPPPHAALIAERRRSGRQQMTRRRTGATMRSMRIRAIVVAALSTVGGCGTPPLQPDLVTDEGDQAAPSDLAAPPDLAGGRDLSTPDLA